MRNFFISLFFTSMFAVSIHAVPVLDPAASTPADNAVGVNGADDIVLQYNAVGNIGFNSPTSYFVIYTEAGTAFETFVAVGPYTATGDNGGSAAAVGTTIVLNPGSNLPDGKYYVHAYDSNPQAGGPVYDIGDSTSGGAFTDNTTYNFTVGTVSVPLFGPFGAALLVSLFGFFGYRKLKQA